MPKTISRLRFSLGLLLLLVAIVAVALRLLNPPQQSASVVVQMPRASLGASSPRQIHQFYETQSALLQSNFVITHAMRDSQLRFNDSKLQVRNNDGWASVSGHISDPVTWIQANLKVEISKNVNGAQAILTLTSSNGTKDDLLVLLRGIERAYHQEVADMEEMARRKKAEALDVRTPD